MINLSKIDEYSKSGLVAFVKIGNAYAVSKKVFDSETGVELDSVVEAIDLVDLEVKKAELLKAADQIESLIVQLKLLR